MAYDFLQFGVFDAYIGMLGLDFFKNERLSFDFETNTVLLETLSEKDRQRNFAQENKQLRAKLSEMEFTHNRLQEKLEK